MIATAEINSVAENQLPAGWRTVRLEDLVTPYNAFWGTDEPFPNSTEALVLGVGNITNEGNIKLDRASKRYLARNETEGIALEGDLLVVKSSGSASNIRSGKTGICPPELSGKIACSNFMIRLTVKRDLAEPYLLWLILNSNHAKAFVRLIAGSTTYPNIKWSSYKDFSFPLPSLAEQKRIAGILQEQMAAVERARACAEAQLQAAKALPAAHLRTVFSSPEAHGWQKKKLGDVFKVKSGEGLTAKAMTQGGLYPVYGGNGINGYHDSYLFEESKIVIGRVGAYCGCIHTTEPKSWITDNALYVSEKFNEFKDEFMVHALCFLDLNTKANSMAQPLVTGQLIYPLEIGIPPLDEQPRLAGQLSAQMSSAERLCQTLTEQLDAINQLPAALLRRAFSGEL